MGTRKVYHPKADIGSNSGAILKSFVERVERLSDEKDAIAGDIREVYAEAKGNGFDTKALRVVIKRRKADAAELAEHEALVDTYSVSLGMAPIGGEDEDDETTSSRD